MEGWALRHQELERAGMICRERKATFAHIPECGGTSREDVFRFT